MCDIDIIDDDASKSATLQDLGRAICKLLYVQPSFAQVLHIVQ